MKEKLYKAREWIKLFIKTYIFVDPLFVIRRNFKLADAKEGLRTTYPLNASSIVFDLGGYKGEWAQAIWEKYSPEIYIFEPVQIFFDGLRKKFAGNLKIHTFNYGLSDKKTEEMISMQNDASSTFAGDKNTSIQLQDIAAVIVNLKIQKIDLLKINIEGGEFQVLPRLIESGLISICRDIQVQFHHFYPNAEKLREGIRSKLQKTHHVTYDYPFTFENWRKND